MQRVSETETTAPSVAAHAKAEAARVAYYAARPCRKAVFGGQPNRRRLSASYHATKGAR